MIRLITMFMMLMLLACKHQPDVPSQYPLKISVYDFYVEDLGNQSAGYCGETIIAELDSGDQVRYFKCPDRPPSVVKGLLNKYEGVFIIHEGVGLCNDGRPDPIPGDRPPRVKTQRVEIIEWRKKL